MPNVCSLGKWSESGGAVDIIRLHIREANAMRTPIVLAAIAKGATVTLGVGKKPGQRIWKDSIMGKGALHLPNQRRTSWILVKLYYMKM